MMDKVSTVELNFIDFRKLFKKNHKQKFTHRRVWLMTSLSFSWSVEGNILSLFLSAAIDGRLRKSCCVLMDVNGSLLNGDADCWRYIKCGYCCLNDELKFMKPEMDGEVSRVEFCKQTNRRGKKLRVVS